MHLLTTKTKKYYYKSTNLFEKLRTILMKTLIDTFLLCFDQLFQNKNVLKSEGKQWKSKRLTNLYSHT